MALNGSWGFNQVEEYPLIVFAAVDKEEVLTGWRESLLSAGIVALLLGFLGE